MVVFFFPIDSPVYIVHLSLWFGGVGDFLCVCVRCIHPIDRSQCQWISLSLSRSLFPLQYINFSFLSLDTHIMFTRFYSVILDVSKCTRIIASLCPCDLCHPFGFPICQTCEKSKQFNISLSFLICELSIYDTFFSIVDLYASHPMLIDIDGR